MMDDEKFNAILSRQMPDGEKRKRADFVVDTSHGLQPVRAQIKNILAEVVKMPAAASEGDHQSSDDRCLAHRHLPRLGRCLVSVGLVSDQIPVGGGAVGGARFPGALGQGVRL